MTGVIAAHFDIALSNPIKVISASHGTHELLDFSPNDFISGRISLLERIHPRDHDISAKLFSPEIHDSGFYNIRVRHANGRICCVKALHTKYKNELDNTIHLDLVLEEAKSLYHQTEDQSIMLNFRAMMENTDDYIYFKDRHHVFTGASQTLINITDPSEHWTDLLGLTDYDVFAEEYADIYYELEKQVFSGIKVAHEEQEIIDNNGNKGWVDNRKYPIYDGQNNIIGLFGIARDITPRKLMENQLRKHQDDLEEIISERTAEIKLALDAAEQANKAKSEFLSAMSHEFRTPLNSILGFAQLLENNPNFPLTEEQYEDVEYIRQSGLMLLELVNQVLDLSRIESGNIDFVLGDVRLADIFHECLPLLQKEAEIMEVHLKFECDHDIIIRADRNLLKQIILNLATNAIKYNKHGGSVTISCSEKNNGMVRVSVIDTGCGIASDKQDQLFNAFTRLGKENSTILGTGIGLNIVKRIVDVLDGELGYSSIENEGSTFWFELASANKH